MLKRGYRYYFLRQKFMLYTKQSFMENEFIIFLLGFKEFLIFLVYSIPNYLDHRFSLRLNH